MRSNYFDKNSYNKAFQKMQYENVLAMRVSLETGLRIDDVLSLRPENLQANYTIVCIAKKTGKRAVKKISKNLFTLLFKNAGKYWVFPSPKDERQHRTRQAVWHDLKKSSGCLKGFSPHSARKTYAVETLHSEGIGTVQKELQHSRLDTTMLYAFSDILNGNKNSLQISEMEINHFASIVAEKIIQYLKENLSGRL